MSARHCQLERKGPNVLVRDLGAKNGVFVDGVRTVLAPLVAGARLRLGQVALLVEGVRAGSPITLVGEAPLFTAAVGLAMRAARTRVPVLLLGESGTGKELFARLVHEGSPRGAGPLVALNCAAIPRELVESELFGHEKGAFTGADTRRAGVFEQATGGTLFLDEIGDLPLEHQPRLLRALELGRVRRVGGQGELDVDVRVVAATHKDLHAEAARGRFRLDLYHRLAAVEVHVPALRDRPGDVARLVARFLPALEREHGPLACPPEVLAALDAHAWPGNVRELKNALARAAVLADGTLRAADLLPRRPVRTAAGTPEARSPSDVALIAAALSERGSLRAAARSLGVSHSTLYDRARRLGLHRRR